MNKSLYKISGVLLTTLLVLLVACNTSDDNGYREESAEWIEFQQGVYDDVRFSRNGYSGYEEEKSESLNGSVYWKTTDSIKLDVPKLETRVTPNGEPFGTDSIQCRYTGWFFSDTGRRIVFESTEDRENGRGGEPIKGIVNTFIPGWRTVLKTMKKGEEVEVCIPHQLAYGEVGSYSNDPNKISIRGYSTLFFTIRVVDVIQK